MSRQRFFTSNVGINQDTMKKIGGFNYDLFL